MTSKGRPRDAIWIDFKEVKGGTYPKAECKHCHKVIAGLTLRLKNHISNCPQKQLNLLESEFDETESHRIINENIDNTNSPTSSTSQNHLTHTASNSKHQSISKFVCKTTSQDKLALDVQVSKFVFATNSPFRLIEHSEFQKFVNMLRPGYKLPDRKAIGSTLLDSVYNSVVSNQYQILKNKTVCMALDGWSNVHNEPIVCITVTIVEDKSVHIVHTISTEDNSHGSEYMMSLAIEGIKKCAEIGCKVKSFVTDNARNMAKMRQDLATYDDPLLSDIITYGCSAHILQLLAKDIHIGDMYGHVKQIIKYFRNVHFVQAKYKQAGGKALVLPCETRWGTYSDCLETLLDNWHIISKVCTDNRSAIDPNINRKVHDMCLKRNMEDHLVPLKKISIANDKVQSDICILSEVTDIWINLVNDFKTLYEENQIPLSMVQKLESRFDMAITPAHYLAYILDPRFRGIKLEEKQNEEAMDFVLAYHSDILPDILKYKANTHPFKEYMFSETAVGDSVHPLTWWKSICKDINSETMEVVNQLHTAVASSAGVERVFSTFGPVHTDIRNRLGNEKAAKLVTIFKFLN